MDYLLDEEQSIIRDTIREFVLKECPRDIARELECGSIFPGELLSRLAGLGFCGLTIPEEYGGEGVNLVSAVVTTEELSVVSPVLALAYAMTVFCGGAAINRMGSEEQKSIFLEPLARGENLVTFGLAETPAGYTSHQSITMQAELLDGGYILNGSKTFVSFTRESRYCLVAVRTDHNPDGKAGITFFIVDLTTPGVSMEDQPKVGMRGTGTKTVIFRDVSVSAKNILGGLDELNRGLRQLESVVDYQNLGLAACSLGLARGIHEYAQQHARERIQFDLPIVKFEAIQFMLVDLSVHIEAMKLLLYHAASIADRNENFNKAINTAMIYALELVQKASLQAMQICGGYGYAMEYDAQRYLRDSFSLPLNGLSPTYFKTALGLSQIAG